MLCSEPHWRVIECAACLFISCFMPLDCSRSSPCRAATLLAHYLPHIQCCVYICLTFTTHTRAHALGHAFGQKHVSHAAFACCCWCAFLCTASFALSYYNALQQRARNYTHTYIYPYISTHAYIYGFIISCSINVFLMVFRKLAGQLAYGLLWYQITVMWQFPIAAATHWVSVCLRVCICGYCVKGVEFYWY